MTNATTVRDVLMAAGDKLFVERAALHRLAEWAPADATLGELLVGLGVVRPNLRNVVGWCCASRSRADEIELMGRLLESEAHVSGILQLWSAWTNAAAKTAAGRLELSRSEPSALDPEDRDVASVEADWYARLARQLAVELAILRHHHRGVSGGSSPSSAPSSAPSTAPLPAPRARDLLLQLSRARGSVNDPMAPFLLELANRTAEGVPPEGVVAGLMLVAPHLGAAALALLGRELPYESRAHEVFDAVDLWRTWRLSLRRDVCGVVDGLLGEPSDSATWDALWRDVLTSVERGLTILERHGTPLGAASTALLTQAEVDLLPEGARIVVTWAGAGETATYDVHVDERGQRHARGRDQPAVTATTRRLADVGAYPQTEVLLARPCGAFSARPLPHDPFDGRTTCTFCGMDAVHHADVAALLAQRPCSCGSPLGDPAQGGRLLVEVTPGVWRHTECAATETTEDPGR